MEFTVIVMPFAVMALLSMFVLVYAAAVDFFES